MQPFMCCVGKKGLILGTQVLVHGPVPVLSDRGEFNSKLKQCVSSRSRGKGIYWDNKFRAKIKPK